MRTLWVILCVAALSVPAALPVHAVEKRGDGPRISDLPPAPSKPAPSESEPSEAEQTERDEYGFKLPPMKRRSVAMAALLSAVPSFGAGLYYAHEYPAAISSTVAMATGLGLLLESLLHSHKNSRTVSAVTIMGSAWLMGMIYAPLSVHQSNKVIDQTYGIRGVRPQIGFSHEELYAGVGFDF